MFHLKSKLYNSFVKIDIIGPEIKLYDTKQKSYRHQTVVGAIISLIAVCISLAISLFFFKDIIVKTNPKAYEVIQYQDDTPSIYIDQSGLNFGIMFWSPATSMINDSLITFYGVVQSVKQHTVIARYTLGKCLMERDFKVYESLFEDMKEEIDSSWYCVSGMIFNNTVISKYDPNYIIPFTQHGMSSKKTDPLYFEVGGVRCRNSTSNNFSCLPSEEIDNILVNANYRINMIDNMFDSNNYDNPVTPIIREIMGSASPSTYAANYINLNNVKFVTHDGFLFDNINVIDSFQFNDRVEIVSNVVSGSLNEGNIFMFRLEGQNTPVLYERYYIRIQEILANIGGVVKCIFLIAKAFNYFHISLMRKKRVLEEVFSKYITFGDITQKHKIIPPPNKKSNKSSMFIQVKDSPFQKIEESEDKKNSESHMSDESLSNFNFFKIDKRSFSFSDKKLQMNDLEKKNLSKSVHINFFQYAYLYIRNCLSKKKRPKILKNLEISGKLRKYVFNESTIFKLFFDMERLKKILFNENQRKAFNLIKVNINALGMKNNNQVDLNFHENNDNFVKANQ